MQPHQQQQKYGSIQGEPVFPAFGRSWRSYVSTTLNGNTAFLHEMRQKKGTYK
jgi:hypothetical protein